MLEAGGTSPRTIHRFRPCCWKARSRFTRNRPTSRRRRGRSPDAMVAYTIEQIIKGEFEESLGALPVTLPD
jgi:hypothetical protein